MMASPPDERPIDERVLVRYLLGALPQDETERLDELSIADDEVAWRLRAVEYDLVDAYVRGELSGETLEQFRSVFLASPQRRHKVEFARALLAQARGPTSEEAPRAPGTPAAAPGAPAGARVRMLRRPSFPQWLLAAAAVAAVAGASYLFIENQRLRDQVSQTQAARTEVEQTAQQLRAELEQERSTTDAIRDELARLRESLPSVRVPTLRPLTLLPLRRGASRIATVALPKDAAEVLFRLRLESDDYQGYEVELRDSATGTTVWRSRRLAARSDGPRMYVELQLPAAVLKAQNYTLNLAGHPVRGPAEFVTSYAFRVERSGRTTIVR